MHLKFGKIQFFLVRARTYIGKCIDVYIQKNNGKIEKKENPFESYWLCSWYFYQPKNYLIVKIKFLRYAISKKKSTNPMYLIFIIFRN